LIYLQISALAGSEAPSNTVTRGTNSRADSRHMIVIRANSQFAQAGLDLCKTKPDIKH
jgi:hypothetical protein